MISLNEDPLIVDGKVVITNEEVLNYIKRQKIEYSKRENDFRMFDQRLYDHFNNVNNNLPKLTTAQRSALKFSKFQDNKLFRSFMEEETKCPTGELLTDIDINKIKSMTVLMILKIFFIIYKLYL
jgi:hypothetical protein